MILMKIGNDGREWMLLCALPLFFFCRDIDEQLYLLAHSAERVAHEPDTILRSTGPFRRAESDRRAVIHAKQMQVQTSLEQLE